MVAFFAGALILSNFGQTSLDHWKQLQCQGRIISKRYFNYAEGFSLAVPIGLKGLAGQAAGPERGVSIPLSHNCTGVVVVYGEPNSAEWQTPADAIKWEIDSTIKDDSHADVKRYKTRLGRLKAAGVSIHPRATVEVKEIVVAFRPGGGPVYTAMLTTTETRYEKDREVFRKVLGGFRLEPWR
jgi:hypothetical protein